MARRTVSFGEAMRLFGAGGAGGAAGAPGPRGDGPPPESVSSLAARIKGALESLGDPVRVTGEVSNFVDKGHWYFSLKDEGAVVSCAMWQEQARRVGWTPKEGDAVIATGGVSFFAKQGRAQLYVRSIERVGTGSLQERFEALCRELRGLGYFDESRKRPLPSFPRRVAVVTSATGAAVHDCLRTAAHRCPAVGLVLVDVRVQGEGAAREVARAVRALDRNADALGIDAILVTRGGGSIEDLWAFNEREVADAVFARRRLPIVAAIGHESDTTIVELVADRRASTPTQAMMLLTPDREELGEQVASLADRLGSSLRRSVRERRELLGRIARHAFLRSPLVPVEERRGDLGDAVRRLERAIDARRRDARRRLERADALLGSLRPDAALARGRREVADRSRRLASAVERAWRRSAERLAALGRQLEAVSPEQVLARGFSYTMTADGRLVRRTTDVAAGEVLRTSLVDGTILSRVEPGTGGDPAPRTERGGKPAPRETPARRPGQRSERPSSPGPASFDLFGESK